MAGRRDPDSHDEDANDPASAPSEDDRDGSADAESVDEGNTDDAVGDDSTSSTSENPLAEAALDEFYDQNETERTDEDTGEWDESDESPFADKKLDMHPDERDAPDAVRERSAHAHPQQKGATARPTQTDHVTHTDPVDAVDVGLGGGSTAPDDEEMPLTDHVEEMALRAMAVMLVVIGVGGITLFYADELINFLWYSFIGPGLAVCPGPECPKFVRPRVYNPLALVLARLKMASLVGLVVALPVAVYQTYRFMRPGLYPRERRYYLAAVPTSLVLAAVGLAFAYFAILPAMFHYFTSYSKQAGEIAFGLTQTFNLIILMLGFFALTFQIPLLVMLGVMMGITSRQWLESRRLYFWGGFGAVAFLFSPDPTGIAPLMVAITMIALFEGTLTLLRWTSGGASLFAPEPLRSLRPYAWGIAVIAGYLASPAPLPESYYTHLPGVIRETLAFNELVTLTPVIAAVALIVLFELVAYLVRRFAPDSRTARRAFTRLRFPAWAVAIVAGYFASKNPPGLHAVAGTALSTRHALIGVAILIIAYELLILGLAWRENRA